MNENISSLGFFKIIFWIFGFFFFGLAFDYFKATFLLLGFSFISIFFMIDE